VGEGVGRSIYSTREKRKLEKPGEMPMSVSN
jgi:hypothetical protein